MSELYNSCQQRSVKIGELEIMIDEEATAEYYDKLTIVESQKYRNFATYIDYKMTAEEKNIFDLFCINPKKLNVESACFSKDDKWVALITTSIIGDFIAYPESAYVKLDDVAKNGIEILDGIKDYDIKAGHFKVHIVAPDKCELSDTFNHHTVNIEIHVDGLPWLLNEKCNHQIKTPSKFTVYLFFHFPRLSRYLTKICFYIQSLISNSKQQKVQRIELEHQLEKIKNKYKTEYKILNGNEISEYKKQWVNSFLPADADKELKKKAYELCAKNKKYNSYLWQIFSFDIIGSEENPAEKFDSTKKNNCILLFETNSGCFAVKLLHAERINESDIKALCEKVVGWSDYVITADDFSWTYSRTHEDGWCGPYFYKKNL